MNIGEWIVQQVTKSEEFDKQIDVAQTALDELKDGKIPRSLEEIQNDVGAQAYENSTTVSDDDWQAELDAGV